MNTLEEIATAKNPAWRELFRKQGRRFPSEMRRELEPLSAWETEGRAFIEHLHRDLLDTKPEPPLGDVMMNKFSAVLEFSPFVLRAFLTGNYSIEKHSSDVFDQFQLRYLAMDRFVIVTGDPDLSKRTARSLQADRIMTFQNCSKYLLKHTHESSRPLSDVRSAAENIESTQNDSPPDRASRNPCGGSRMT